jgi:hypothetical protein
MVLMTILELVREDEFRRYAVADGSQEFLGGFKGRGKTRVGKISQHDIQGLGAAEQGTCARLRLAPALKLAAADNPGDVAANAGFLQAQEGASATDFDVVAVGADAQDTHPRPRPD